MTHERPRRLSPPAPYGALLKRTSELPQRQAMKAEPNGDADYLALVWQLPCLSCGMEPSEAAHVRFASAAYGKASGLQKKPEGKWCLPLCSSCHRLAKDAQHNRNEQEFWAALGLNPLLTASQLYAQRTDFVAMLSVVHVAITNRSKR